MHVPLLVRTTSRIVGRLLPDTAARLAETLATRPRPRRGIRPRSAGALPAGEPITLRYGLKALRWGERGPIIIALHGWEGHPDQFRAMAVTLAAQGFQVIALTGPGHGTCGGRNAHPSLFADALFEAAVELRAVHAVMGHSMGAGAAVLALANGLPASRGVLLAGPAGFEGVLHRMAEGLGLPEAARRRFLRRMEARTGLALADTRAPNLLPSVRVPLLIVHDRDDRQVPFGDAELLAAHAPRARLLPTEGLGHGRILRAPVVLDAVSGFLGAREP